MTQRPTNGARTDRRHPLLGIGLLAAVAVALGACSSPAPTAEQHVERVSGGPSGCYVVSTGIHQIKHVIIIEQENRSFDSYFGTFPGADGIPMKDGAPTVCVPLPVGGCQKPYHDTADVNGGGPHNEGSARKDVNRGQMDGFVVQAAKGKRGCGLNLNNPACSQSTAPDVMGYHTAAEIPNYWTYARRIQAMDATSSLNRSAGVSHSRVLRGRSLSRAAISSRSA